MIKPWDPSVVCPWEIKWFRSHRQVIVFVDNLCPLEMTQESSFVHRWYHDVNIPNVWNPKGNAWRKDDTIFVHCYNEKVSGNI